MGPSKTTYTVVVRDGGPVAPDEEVAISGVAVPVTSPDGPLYTYLGVWQSPHGRVTTAKETGRERMARLKASGAALRRSGTHRIWPTPRHQVVHWVQCARSTASSGAEAWALHGDLGVAEAMDAVAATAAREALRVPRALYFARAALLAVAGLDTWDGFTGTHSLRLLARLMHQAWDAPGRAVLRADAGKRRCGGAGTWLNGLRGSGERSLCAWAKAWVQAEPGGYPEPGDVRNTWRTLVEWLAGAGPEPDAASAAWQEWNSSREGARLALASLREWWPEAQAHRQAHALGLCSSLHEVRESVGDKLHDAPAPLTYGRKGPASVFRARAAAGGARGVFGYEHFKCLVELGRCPLCEHRPLLDRGFGSDWSGAAPPVLLHLVTACPGGAYRAGDPVAARLAVRGAEPRPFVGLDPTAGAFHEQPADLRAARQSACAQLAAAPDMSGLWCGGVTQRLAAASPALHADLEHDGEFRDLVFRLFLGLPAADSNPGSLGVRGWNFEPRDRDVASGCLRRRQCVLRVTGAFITTLVGQLATQCPTAHPATTILRVGRRPRG